MPSNNGVPEGHKVLSLMMKLFDLIETMFCIIFRYNGPFLCFSAVADANDVDNWIFCVSFSAALQTVFFKPMESNNGAATRNACLELDLLLNKTGNRESLVSFSFVSCRPVLIN